MKRDSPVVPAGAKLVVEHLPDVSLSLAGWPGITFPGEYRYIDSLPSRPARLRAIIKANLKAQPGAVAGSGVRVPGPAGGHSPHPPQLAGVAVKGERTVSQPCTGGLLPVADAVSAGEPWLWWALTGTVKLAGMSHPPDGFPFSCLHERGLDTVVSLVGPPPYDPAPLRSRAHRLKDLYGGIAPGDAVAEEREVRRAVGTVTSLLDEGAGVVVHCHAGIGRTGLVIGSVLVSAGHDPGQVTSWLAAVQRARGAKGWPESPWQGEVLASFSAG